jgi:hypothetical protein
LLLLLFLLAEDFAVNAGRVESGWNPARMEIK